MPPTPRKLGAGPCTEAAPAGGRVTARVRRVVTDRRGGRSAAPYESFNLGGHVGDAAADVVANRERLARELGVDAGSLVWMDQVHGAGVAVVDGSQDGAPPQVDALVTATPGLVLCVLVADCVPVLLADPVAGVVAAVHAGREGVRHGVVLEALRTMAGLGARPGDVQALLGPAVCGLDYEVPRALQVQVARVAGDAAVRSRTGTPALDLRAGLTQVLRGAGVGQVVQDPRCTVEDRRLFSHRRDGVTGRQAGVVWLQEEPARGHGRPG